MNDERCYLRSLAPSRRFPSPGAADMIAFQSSSEFYAAESGYSTGAYVRDVSFAYVAVNRLE
jgi:hypothetical protein